MAETGTKLTREQKIAKVRQAYRDLDAGKPGAGDFAPDCVWHSVIWGEVRGADAIRAALRQQREATEEFKIEPHAIVADDEHLVALLNVKVRAKGQTVEERLVQVFHVDDQGQAREIWSYGTNPDPMKKLVGR